MVLKFTFTWGDSSSAVKKVLKSCNNIRIGSAWTTIIINQANWTVDCILLFRLAQKRRYNIIRVESEIFLGQNIKIWQDPSSLKKVAKIAHPFLAQTKSINSAHIAINTFTIKIWN